MSRRMQFLTLSLVVGVSIVFGMVISASLYRVAPLQAEAATGTAGVLRAALPVGTSVTVPSFADIAERANPAVVAIRSVEFKKVRRQTEMFDPFHYFFGPDLNPHHRRNRGDDEGDDGGQDDEERRQEGSGSGFIIRREGYILTNNHVVDGASKLTVTLQGGEKFDAVVKGKDESTDVALLKIDSPHDLPVLPLGDSDSLRIGEWVMAIGNPLGSELGDDHSVTIGVVSAKGRQLRDLNRDFSLPNYIQTDAAINFGNSGGPLLNARGEVIGINTAITRNYGNMPGLIQGIGFALPINLAKNVLDQLMTTGKVSRGALSISVKPVSDDIQKYYHLPNKKGAFVDGVNPGGPADRAGMKAGDIITSVDSKEIDETSELIRLISAHKPGETVSVGVLREEPLRSLEAKTLRVKLADRAVTLAASAAQEPEESDDEGADKPATAARLGFTVTEITPSIERELRLPRTHVQGVVVTEVSPESHAWEAGLQKGAIITRIGGSPVRSLEDFRRAAQQVEKAQAVRLSVTRYNNGDEESRFVFFEAE